MNQNLGKRNKQAVQVLNQVEYDENGNPIGMKEDRTNPLSANFGTEREPRRGGCYRGDGSSYVDFGHIPDFKVQNFELECTVSAPDRYNLTSNKRILSIELADNWSSGWYLFLQAAGYFSITFRPSLVSTDNNPLPADYYNIKIRKIGNSVLFRINETEVINNSVNLVYPTTGGNTRLLSLYNISLDQHWNSDLFAVKYTELDENGNFVRLLAKYNCSENSGDVCYDSSGNGHHGTIVDAITTTPEENPNSIHQYQDVYSFENEEGFTGLNNIAPQSVTMDITNRNWLIEATYLTNSVLAIQSISNRTTTTKWIRIVYRGTSPYYSVFSIEASYDFSGGGYMGPNTFGTVQITESGDANTSGGFVNVKVYQNNNILGYRIERLGGTGNLQFVVTPNGTRSYTIIENTTSLKHVEVDVGENDFNSPSGSFSLSNMSDPANYFAHFEMVNNGLTVIKNPFKSTSHNFLLPKNASITLPPFKDVLGNNLQYVGKVPGKAKFVQSYCFNGISTADQSYIDFGDSVTNPTTATTSFRYGCSIMRTSGGSGVEGIMGIPVKTGTILRYGIFIENNKLCINYFDEFHYISNYIIEIGKKYDIIVEHTKSDSTIRVYINGIHKITLTKSLTYLDFTNDFRIGAYSDISNQSVDFFPGLIYNAWMEIDGVKVHHWPLCEPVINPTTHIYYDTIGNAHGTLENGTINNTGYQDYYHYLQNGFIRRNTGDIIPIKNDKTGFADGSNLNDNDAILQDGKSFLNTGTLLKPYAYPALQQADKDEHFWFIGEDENGNPIPRKVSHYELALENLMSDKLFIDKTDKS